MTQGVILSYRHIDTRKVFVRQTASEWDVDAITKAFSDSTIIWKSCAGEKVAKLVQTTREDAVGSVKRLFYGISVVAIDVDV